MLEVYMGLLEGCSAALAMSGKSKQAEMGTYFIILKYFSDIVFLTDCGSTFFNTIKDERTESSICLPQQDGEMWQYNNAEYSKDIK